jgi:hypothetical protein
MMLQKAESSLVANDTVDARNRWWPGRGAGLQVPDARLRVPVLLMKPAASGGRRKVARIRRRPSVPILDV